MAAKNEPIKVLLHYFLRQGGGGDFDLQIGGGKIPYNSNPVFLGITFDERLNFSTHYSNLRLRALKRLNILKIFSHKSWHLNQKTLITIYRALIGSIFDYSFFTIACVAETSLGLIQRVQNRAIRIIYKLDWQHPTKTLFDISGVLDLKARFLQLGARYLLNTIRFKNDFMGLLVTEYIRSLSAITSHQKMKTPLCYLFLVFALYRLSYSTLD